MRAAICALLAVPLIAAASCGSGEDHPLWQGTIDTLPSGQIVVHNTSSPLWAPGNEWRVQEDLRIGSLEDEGPAVFGEINSLAIDATGRFWIFDSQAQQMKVFGPSGQYVRTIGRKGGGPGEFAQVMHVELAPDGQIWVIDPGNVRLSVFDTAGAYKNAKPAIDDLLMWPWPGRFDSEGNYYAPVSLRRRQLQIALVRYDTQFTPRDTLSPPHDPVARATFEFVSPDGGMSLTAGVPYQGRLNWQLSSDGTFWALITDRYHLFQLSPTGDTIRSITKEFTPVPVTDSDREKARDDLKWFTKQGGRIDLSKLPRQKPAVRDFFLDDERNIWVERAIDARHPRPGYDVFDPEGRFLGSVVLPFQLRTRPIVLRGAIYGVTTDTLDVQYVVRGRILKRAR